MIRMLSDARSPGDVLLSPVDADRVRNGLESISERATLALAQPGLPPDAASELAGVMEAARQALAVLTHA